MGVYQQMDTCTTGGVNYYSLMDANAASYDSTRIMAMGASEYYGSGGWEFESLRARSLSQLRGHIAPMTLRADL